MSVEQRSIAFFRIGGREVDVTSVLESRPTFVIGSDPRSHLMLLEPSVAASHAMLSLRDDGPVIVSCFPHLETFVNDKRIKAPTRLNPGDRVRVGEAELLFLQEERAGMPLPVAPAALRPRAAVLPVAAKASAPVLQYAPASASAVLAPGEIFMPRHEAAAASSGIGGIVLGLVALLALVAVIGFGIVGNQTTAATSSLTQYAYRDGNISIVMFDADW
ncbi:MAG: FHA domain-containing protein [Anaerolineae bacterium]|nr:FHA domain-containing protein [Anaerolineae bacterium]